MKFVIIVTAMFVSNFALADASCPSVDQTISSFMAGETTALQVDSALKCKLSGPNLGKALCSTRVGIAKDYLEMQKAALAMELEIGSQQAVDAAQTSLNAVLNACGN